MFERFTEKAIKAVMLAQEEARRLGHRELTTLQLILGLIAEGTGVAAKVLRSTGVKLKNARLEVEKIQGRGLGSGSEIGFNNYSKQVFEFSLAEAEQLKQSHIDTEHLLLGLLRQADEEAIVVWQNLRVNPIEIRDRILQALVDRGDENAAQFLQNATANPSQQKNPERYQAYLYLIQQLLRSPQCQYQSILDDNSELLDTGFIQMMKQMAEAVKMRGETQDAELLIQIAEEITKTLSLSSLTPPASTQPIQSGNTNNSVTIDTPLIIVLLENEERQEAYRNLIAELGRCPRGQEPAILMSNPDLLDAGLVQKMEELAANYEDQNDRETADFLNNLALSIADLLNNTDWVRQREQMITDAANLGSQNPVAFLRNINRQMFAMMQNLSLSASPEEYFNFLGTLFQVMGESRLNPQAVYPILQTNLDKLDDNFSSILQAYVGVMLSQSSPELAQGLAGSLVDFSSLIMDFPLGSKAINIEIAINCYEIATTVFTRESGPEVWTAVQNNLGIAYSQRIRGDRADNLEQAITHYQNALQVRTRETFPSEWAETQMNLGNAYLQRICGERADNLERAIQFTQASLTVYTRSTFPQRCGMAQNNLGEAYRNRIRGDRAENLEQAIESFNAALSVYTRELSPTVWATVQNNLGLAYSERIRGERANNLEKAIQSLEATLIFYTPSTFPFEWARTQSNLASAYFYRICGTKADNIEQAIQACQAALTVYTRESFPEHWAKDLFNLSNIYVGRIRGEKADNIEQAIQFVEAAFTVFTSESFPQKRAESQLTLGNAYSQRIRGEQANNWEQAIQAYQSALTVLTYDSFPEQWAMLQHNISRAYMNRIRGDKADNLEKAVGFGEASLTVRTREAFAVDWAMSHDNLARVYSGRIRGEKADNLERAIQAGEAALSVYTHEAFPEEWAGLQSCLGEVYVNRIKGEKAENVELAIQCLTNALNIYTHESFPEKWATTQYALNIAYRERIKGEKVENIEQSIQSCENAFKVFTREGFPQKWAGNQINRGLSYWQRINGDRADNLERAIAALEIALTVYTRDGFPTDWALTQANLGNVYFHRIRGQAADNLELSIQAYEAALTVYTQEAFPFEWAKTQSNLSNAYRERVGGDRAENIELAIQACEAALSKQTASGLPYYWAVTQHTFGAGYTFRLRGDREDNLDRAIKAYEAAISIFTRDKFPEQWAMIQHNLGEVYRQRLRGDKAKNLERAIAHFKNALQVFTPTSYPHDCAKTQFNLGFTHLKAKQLNHAYEALASSIETLESLRGEIISGEQAKRQHSEQSFAISQAMVKVCLEIAATKPNYYARALEYVERNKARYLVELLSNRDLVPKGNVHEEILNELKQLRQEIAAEQRHLDNYRNTLGDRMISSKYPQRQNPSSVAIIPDRTRLNELQKQLDDFIASNIQPIDPNFSAIQKVNPISFSDIQALLLDDKTAIVEWFLPIPFYKQASFLPLSDKFDPNIIGNSLYTFITTSEGKYPIVLQSKPEVLNDFWKWNGEYFQEYRENKEGWKNYLNNRLKRLAEILQIDLIISNVPKNCERLILIPHWFLHLFPLHALPLSNGDCVLDRFPQGVSYAPNCQLLQICQNQKRHTFSHFFGVQNPTLDLAYANIEVEVIRQTFKPNDNVLAQEEAHKAAINNQHLSLINCAHFSCHGYFNFSDPLSSALSLAGAKDAKTSNCPDLEKDLTLGEIFDLNLNQCRLVTLSACETGIIDPETSHVEYVSFPSGFLYAGSPSVVSSLWTVNDLSTAFLMIKFYQNLQGVHSVAVALNQAQLWLQDITKAELKAWITANSLPLDPAMRQNLNKRLHKLQDNQKPFQDPFYWAAFCAIGQ